MKFSKQFSFDKEWLCVKIPLVFFWLGVIRSCLSKDYKLPLPLGICKLVDCSFFFEGFGLVIIVLVALLLSIAYLLEYKMKWATLGIFLISIIVFTGEESSGVLRRNGMLSFIFLAQSCAYWLNGVELLKLKYSRIQYSIQAVSVGYFLSACSKLVDSGICWPIDGARITLQVLKSFHYEYYTTFDRSELIKATEVVQFLQEYQGVLTILLACSLVVEFFALSAAINRIYARAYGLVLLLMHIGISYFMDIFISSFAIPMVILLINPLYLAVLLYHKIFKKSTVSTTFKRL
jgi:hypothetical protein